jgi:hypothetical protein
MPPSSSLCKHCKLVFDIDATRATFSPEGGNDALVVQVTGTDLVRSARDDLLRSEYAAFDQATDAVMGDAKPGGGLGHGQPLAVLFSGTVGVNPIHPPHRADTVRGPGFPLTSRPELDLEARRAERQAREAAKDQVDHIRPDTASRDFSRVAEGAAETAQKATEAREAPAAPSPSQHPNRRTHAPRNLSANRHRPATRPV